MTLSVTTEAAVAAPAAVLSFYTAGDAPAAAADDAKALPKDLSRHLAF